MRVLSVTGKDNRINKVRCTESHLDKIPTKNKHVIVEVKRYEMRARLVLLLASKSAISYTTRLLFGGVLCRPIVCGTNSHIEGELKKNIYRR
jgi:hypothetical protein